MTEIKAPITANVWKVLVKKDQSVVEGDTLVILEAMKMEINIDAPFDATVSDVFIQEGGKVNAGDRVITLA